jgi:glycosyltransferase involved in cell wall biosynthesis
MPAHDDVQGIGKTIASLLRQDYTDPFCVILVDDQSPDGTVEVARHTGAAVVDRLTILPGALLPAGWTDMLWAMKQGVEHP